MSVPSIDNDRATQPLPATDDKPAAGETQNLQQLIQASKLALLGQLAAGIAHELRNPLAVLRIESDEWARLAQNLPGEAKQEALRHCETVNRNIDKMVSTIDRIHSMSSNATAGFGSLDLHEILEEVTHWSKRLLTPLDVDIAVEPLAQDPGFFGNETQIEQVFLNLIRNASEAMRAAGRGKTIRIRTGSDDREVFVDVEDDGPGIAPDTLPYIFDPFFTTKPEGEGMGLGLSIVAEMIKGHSGTIEVASETGGGTRFHIRLPHDRRQLARRDA